MVPSTANIRIRPFLPGDQTNARQIILDGLGEHFGHINPNLNPDLVDIETFYLKQGNFFFIAEREGTMVGTGALVTESGDTARIVRLSVIQNQRGLGIGRQLVEHIIEVAKQRDYYKIIVETNHDWYPAIKLYESCGFRQFAKDEESTHFHLIL
jgi:GNAT superfamily N-acetyltransferase